MAKGILGTIGLAATLVFAIPVGILGLQFLLLDGQPVLGAAFLVIAVLMIAVEEYLTTPTDLPGMVFGKTVDAAVVVPDENGEDEHGDNDGTN
jgi:hypothetical protein